MIKVAEDMLTELLAGAATMAETLKENALPIPEGLPTIEELTANEEPPSWYTYRSYDDAEISFEDRKYGEVKVKLKDCTAQGSFELKRASKADAEGNASITMQSATAFCRFHLDTIEGEGRAKIFHKDPPKDAGAKKDWESFCGQIREKDLMRLVQGIVLFRRDVGAEGND